MRQTHISLLLILSVLFLSGCKSVKTLLNQHNVSSADEQKNAIETNSISLSRIKTCDFAFNIGARDFDTILIPAFNKLINGRQIKHIRNYVITKLSTTTDAELINLKADFQLTFDTLNASIKGRLIGSVSFSVRGDSLILFPAFKYIHISDLTFKKTRKFERKAMASFFNLVLDGFTKKINGFVNSKIQGIPLNLVDREIAAKELVSDPNTQVTLSHPLKILTPISIASCLIDKRGIHVLGSFDSILNASPQKARIDFNSFQKNFLSKKNNCFADLPVESKTYMVLSKSAFARIFNSALHNESIDIKYSTDNFLSDKSDKNITIDLDEIHCSDVHFDCPQIHVVPNCDCPINWHCGGGIGGKLCRVGEAAAKATWFSTVYPTCQASKMAEEEANVAIRAQCEAARLAAIGHCEVIKKSLEVVLTSKVSVGDIHTTVSSSGTAAGTISNLSLGNDLSKIVLSLTANVNASVQATFGFTPEGPAGHLVCALSFDHPYNCEASAVKTLNSESIATTFDNASKELLLIKFRTNPVDLNITIDPSPLTLMNRDIPTLINCPLFMGLANLVKGFHDIFSDGNFGNNNVNAIFNGKYNYTLKERTFNLPIKATRIKLLEKSIPLSPIAKNTYIGFFN